MMWRQRTRARRSLAQSKAHQPINGQGDPSESAHLRTEAVNFCTSPLAPARVFCIRGAADRVRPDKLFLQRRQKAVRCAAAAETKPVRLRRAFFARCLPPPLFGRERLSFFFSSASIKCPLGRFVNSKTVTVKLHFVTNDHTFFFAVRQVFFARKKAGEPCGLSFSRIYNIWYRGKRNQIILGGEQKNRLNFVTVFYFFIDSIGKECILKKAY